MKNEVIVAFLLENINESMVVCVDDEEKYIGSLKFNYDEKKISLYDSDKNIINIEKKYIKEVDELEYNSLTIVTNDGKIILEEF